MQNSTMKEKTFFRSGRLDDATTRDVELLLKKYDIKSVIDLRAETEGTSGEHTPFFPATVFDGDVARAAAQSLSFAPPNKIALMIFPQSYRKIDKQQKAAKTILRTSV